ncbi:MAG: DUF58 domain-containing protein [Anaerolineae bacterium]|nr:DUF58 domain-containing protein [Anaerolineae bacterium]
MDQQTKPQIKLNSWLLPALALVCLIVDLLAPYRGWRILYIGLGGAWVLSFFWARTLARHLNLTREMRFGWAQVGDHLVERFTISNDGWAAAVWIEVKDESTMPEYNVSRGTGIKSHDSIRWHTEAVCNRRGLFILGPTRLETSDPFGVFNVTMVYPATRPLLVLPPIVPLPSIEIASGGRSGDARPRANAPDRTVSAGSVREYTTGDSRRWIHWRISARRNELYVRLFDGTPSGDWWILLDVDSHVQVGKGIDATEEHAVILAASLADRGLRDRRAVGLVAHGEDLVWLPPQSGEGHRWEILRSLAMVKPGTRPLSELLERVRPNLAQRTSIIIITPSVNTRWVESLVPLVRRGARVTVLLLDPVSFGGEGDTHPAEAALYELGIANYLITKDVLDRPELRPGRKGVWEWRILGTGKAVPTRKPVDSAWKVLS